MFLLHSTDLHSYHTVHFGVNHCNLKLINTTVHTVRAEGSLVRSDSGLELVQALLPAGRLQAADRRLI